MAFPNRPPIPVQGLLNIHNIGVGNIRLATAAGLIPQVQVAGFTEIDRRNLEAVRVQSVLEQARIQEFEAARAIGMEQRMRMMLENRAQLQQAQLNQLEQEARTVNESLNTESRDNGSSYRDRRDKDRDRERDRRDDRERERSRDRDKRRHDHDRDRWNDQERGDRGRHGRDRSSNRDRSPIRSRNDDDSGSPSDRTHDEDRHRTREDGDKWVSQEPSRTIILRGLNHDVDSRMIGAELMVLGVPVKDIRLIRTASGVSRGFAFVEFHNADDAKRWMDHTQGSVLIQNQYRAFMDYSISRERAGGRELQKNDWVCYKCMAHNFKRREYCYNCNIPRKESEKIKAPDGDDEIGTNPCNTLIFRGLDALTTEEGLVTALNQTLPSSLPPIKNIAIIRDELNTSRGFGFVEFHSVAASTQVLSSIDPAFEVDGKQLMVNYAKNTFNTTMATMQSQSSQYYDNYYQGQYYDSGSQSQYYDYSQYYNQNASTSSSTTSSKPATPKEHSANAAAAVAHAAIEQAKAHKNYQKQTSASTSQTAGGTVNVNGVEYPVYPPPDTTTYQYEETSGFYYDPMTQLYYDANSQYYYNSTTGHYMYWDSDKSTYLPAPTAGDGAGGEDKSKKDGKDRKDKEKVKMAKKIAKDMEKWAKSMNAQKESMKDGPKRFISPSGVPSSMPFESASADAGFAMLTKAKEDKSLMPPPPLMGGSDKSGSSGSKPGLVASYGGDSDSGEEEESSAPLDESKLVDWTKLACLLCKRQFQSKEILTKHTQFSDLHKQNLEQLMLSKGAGSADKIEYRDRAKERRQKYGAPEPPEPRKKKGRNYPDGEASIPIPYEQPTKAGIGGDNIGNKLLQKMGWSHGQGLGKANQGRTDPIQAERRNASAGLGARGGKVVAEAGDSYREALKKTMFARYKELD